MSSNLKVNTILPSTGTNIGVGTAGGSVSITSDTITALTGGSERVRIDSNGKIGINTDSPSRLLHIDTTGSSTEGLVIRSHDNTYPKLQFGANRSNADQFLGLIIASWDGTDVASIHFETGSDTTNKDDGLISFRTASAGTREERLRITPNGSVVIGGDTPATVGQTQLTLRSNSQVGLSLLCGAIQNATITFGGLADGYSSGDSGYDDGKIMYDNSNNHMQFNTAGSERLRITSDGDVNLVDGDLVIQQGGHGIDFSARSGSNAGATSSILDDYEEGVYQPTMTGSSSGSHTFQTYTHLAYTKIGRLVHIQGYININGGSLSGNLKLSLPFTVSNDAAGHSRYPAIGLSWRGHGWSANTGEITFAPQPNTTYGEFVSVTPSGSHTWINNTHVSNNYNMRIGGCYITNS